MQFSLYPLSQSISPSISFLRYGSSGDRRRWSVQLQVDRKHTANFPPGLYGLIAAKTYLQVTGAYDAASKIDNATETTDPLPTCFSSTRKKVEHIPGCSLLVIDAGSDIGGTWGEERLYPNLLSQNSYGMYEFSDLPLSHVVPEEMSGVGQQFIAGWKINRYLHFWAEKWDLKKHIRLNWKASASDLNHVSCLTVTRSRVSAASTAKNGSSTSMLVRLPRGRSGWSATN
jgi:hypothetical protein